MTVVKLGPRGREGEGGERKRGREGECVRWMWRDSGCQSTTMQPTTGGVFQVDVERETVGVRAQQCSLQLGECVRWMWRERQWVSEHNNAAYNWGSVSGGCGERDSGCQSTTMQPTTGGVFQVDVERETVGVRAQQCSLQLGECVRWMWRERQWVSEHNNAAYNWGSVSGGCGETVGVRVQQCSLQLGECVRWMWRERQWVSEHNNAAYNWGSVSGGCGERDSGCQSTTMQPTTGGVCQVDVERETVGVRTQQCSLQLGECVRWMWRETVGVRTQQCSLQLGECVRWMWRETVGVRTQQCSLQLGECVRWMWRERQWVSEHNNAVYNWGSVSGGCGERQWVSEHNNAATTGGVCQVDGDSGCQTTTMQPTTGDVSGVCGETVGVRAQQCSHNWGSVSGGCGERQWVSEHNNAAYNWGSVSGGCGERDSGCQSTAMQPTTGGVCQVDVERETVGVRAQQCSLQLGECVRWMWRERQWVSENNNAVYNWGSVSGGCGERDSGCQNTTMQPTTGGVCQVDVERETVGVRTQQCSLQLGECVRWMWRERQWVSECNNAAYNWGSVSGGCGERDSGCQNTTVQPTTGGVCQVDVERETVGVRTQQCSLQLGECVRWMWRETVGVRTQQCSLQLGECVRWMWKGRQWVSEHNNAAYNWGSVSGGCGKGDSGCQNTTMQPTTGGVCQVDVERETVGVRTQQCSLQLGECVRWMWRDSGCQNTTMQPTTGGVCQVDVERETVGVRAQQCSLQLGECVRWMWRETVGVRTQQCSHNWGSVSGGCGKGDSGCQNTTMQPTTGGVCQVDVERERQ